MEITLQLKDWHMSREEGKQATIAGTYAVMMAGKEISTSIFNGAYGTQIDIPPEILVKINEIDAEIHQAIIDNFTK